MKIYYEYLLTDEKSGISLEDFEERKKLFDEFNAVFDSHSLKSIRHFQPQIGCLNACSICSKHASLNMSWWQERRIRNVVAAIKYVALQYRQNKPYISWERENHRSGVIFSYLDNDIGNYYYLDKFINLMYCELGVTTRISTVGYSRHNKYLNNMHRRINEQDNLDKLAGFRLSFTPYAIGWKSKNEKFSQDEYIMDMANILRIYRPYYNFAGAGSRNMCVELRYKPLVITDKVYDEDIDGYKVIYCNHHIYISVEKNILFKTSYIADPYEHKIVLTEEPIYFYDILIKRNINSYSEFQEVAKKALDNNEVYEKVPIYMLENADGYYYAVSPHITDVGNYGVNIYPSTVSRKTSGIIITERFALNAILKVKRMHNVSPFGSFYNANWSHAYSVLQELKSMAKLYVDNNESEKSVYIMNEVLPMLKAYIKALHLAKYNPSLFFNHEFSIDTGIICNLGAAISEFKCITSFENEPLTPTHERNYGKHVSTMMQEKDVYRVSCEHDNLVVVQKLNLAKTATREGQVEFSKTIQLPKTDEKYDISCLEYKFFIPGQKGEI